MSTLRYNWLRRLGYKTVAGSNFVDPDTGDEWVEIVLRKKAKIKRTSLKSLLLSEVFHMEREDEENSND